MHHIDILAALFTAFLAAQIGAEIAQRLRTPAVVGEIAAGCIVGPSLLGWISPAATVANRPNYAAEPLQALAEIGAVLLLFGVGLETRLDDLKQVGRTALAVGVLGLLLPFVLATGWALLSPFAFKDLPRAMFIGAAFVATSAGITARVLAELGVLNRLEARVILGAAVIDDILAMLLLAGVSSMTQPGGVSFGQLALSLLQAIGFVALIALAGTRVLRRSGPALEAPVNPLSPLTLALAACLGLAVLGAKLGLAPIIGAFLAGMAFAETPQRESLERQMKIIMAFLTPFFFVVTGSQIQLEALASPGAILTLSFITALAVVTKLGGGYLAARNLGHQPALIIGMGMVPRGEVGIIVASLGRSAGLFSNEVYALIIAMSLLTSVLAPPVLKRLLAQEQPRTNDT